MQTSQISGIPNGLAAVVTGAGSGVGQAVARALAGHGLAVALVGRTREKLDRVQRAVAAAGGVAAAFPCDVADPDEVGELAKDIVATFGHPLVLVNNAGLHCELAPIADTTPRKWLQTLAVNVAGPYLMSRAFMGAMVQGGWGRIVNVSSAASLGQPDHIGAVYQLSKVALNHFTRQLAAELEGSGVTANAIHPGEVKTEMWAAIREDALTREGPGRDALEWVQLVEETGGDPPEKAAELILELLAPAANSVNGQFLWIRDGIQKPRKAW